MIHTARIPLSHSRLLLVNHAAANPMNPASNLLSTCMKLKIQTTLITVSSYKWEAKTN